MSRDSQMQKVYDWETATPWYKKVSNLTEKDCERVVKTLNNHTVAYRKKNRRRDVTVQFLNGSGYSYADGREISLRKIWGMNVPVILHEYAHCLVGVDAGHGEKFMGCLAALCSHYMEKDVVEIANSLNQRRIKFESIRLWQERLHLNGRKRLSVSFP